MKFLLILILLYGCTPTTNSELELIKIELDNCKHENFILLDSISLIHFNNEYYRNKPIRKTVAKKKTKRQKSKNTIKSNVKVEKSNFIQSNFSNRDCNSVQCTGMTQKGLRCRNITKNCSGRCYRH